MASDCRGLERLLGSLCTGWRANIFPFHREAALESCSGRGWRGGNLNFKGLRRLKNRVSRGWKLRYAVSEM